MPFPLDDSMLDPRTPDDVIVTTSAREPVWDPTLGIPVRIVDERVPRHRLVAIGDSLTHGFQSGAVFHTDLSYPAMIAYELGWLDHFRYPTYYGHGGLPLNVEYMIRVLEREFGDRLDWWELAAATFRARHVMAEIEHWWERGPGTYVPNVQGINHNLGIYGWDIRDSLSRNADICRTVIAEPKNQILMQLVENANERAALRVLDSARDSDRNALSPVQAADALGLEGTIEGVVDETDDVGDGIETLIVMIGSNNALSTVTNLKVVWSDDGYDDLERKRRFTVWRPTHFQSEMSELVRSVHQVRARHVIWCTIPHVTIAPVARGVSSKLRPGSRYFPHYTRPWISDRDFEPKSDPFITGQEARAVDSAIDQYNDAMTEGVRVARMIGKDWYLFDMAGVLDRLASRRYIDDPTTKPDWWRPYELPLELQALSPVPDSRFFSSGPGGRTYGGLFSLDGVHPTTVAYGVIAQELINIMQLGGVKFYLPDGTTERKGPVKVNFMRLISLDTLISDPPRSVTSDLHLLGWLDQRLDVFRRLLRTGGG